MSPGHSHFWSRHQTFLTNGLILLLVIVPLTLISFFALRSLHTDMLLTEAEIDANNDWVIRNIDQNIQQSIKTFVDDYFEDVVFLMNGNSDLRGWILSQVNVDLVTTYSSEGHKTFPPDDQSTLVNEKALVNEISGEIAYLFSQPPVTNNYRVLIAGNLGPKLLVCNPVKRQIVCILFSSTGLYKRVSDAFNQMAKPANTAILLTLPRAQNLTYSDGNNPYPDFAKLKPIASSPMTGIYSAWQISVYTQDAATPNTQPLLYVAMLLPLFLVIVGSGYGLYRIDQIKRQQVLHQKQFSAELAHEIRTPLTNIRLYVELLKESSPSQTTEYTKILNSEVERLSLLVDNAILLARPDEPSSEDYFQRANPNDIINEAIELLKPLMIENHCAISPVLDSDFLLYFDLDALQRIIINVIDNTCKYAHGSNIHLTSRYLNNQLLIEIGDDGPGIPDFVWRKLSSPYLTRQNLGKKGFGLGLKVCRRLAKRTGGSMDRCEGKNGVQFRLVLPAQQTG